MLTWSSRYVERFKARNLYKKHTHTHTQRHEVSVERKINFKHDLFLPVCLFMCLSLCLDGTHNNWRQKMSKYICKTKILLGFGLSSASELSVHNYLSKIINLLKSMLFVSSVKTIIILPACQTGRLSLPRVINN